MYCMHFISCTYLRLICTMLQPLLELVFFLKKKKAYKGIETREDWAQMLCFRGEEGSDKLKRVIAPSAPLVLCFKGEQGSSYFSAVLQKQFLTAQSAHPLFRFFYTPQAHGHTLTSPLLSCHNVFLSGLVLFSLFYSKISSGSFLVWYDGQ